MSSAGPLHGLNVIEVCDPLGVFAGKLLADMGADVTKVEPPGGDPMRTWEPFLDDIPGPGRSLSWWHYNTNKRSVVLDLTTAVGRARLDTLVAGADVLLHSYRPAETDVAFDFDGLRRRHPRLVSVCITPFGRGVPRETDPANDLIILAGGGPAWNCGYDDHALPPVRGGGNQGYHTASHYAAMSILTALLYRDHSGEGQHIEVNAHAAANVTTEAGSYSWLVAQQTVQRQTGRHAGVNPSMPSQIPCADGRYVNTGIPPRRPDEFNTILQWLRDLGIEDEFHAAPLLEAGAQRERIDLATIASDPEVAAIFGAGREAVNFIASRIPAYDFFAGSQQRGFQVGIIYSPEEAMEDVHFKARGYPVRVEHPELGRTFTYPGAPIRFTASPWSIRRRAPLLGEDNHLLPPG
jgi:benzylsuccinate CoA-transferase BbsE subunit